MLYSIVLHCEGTIASCYMMCNSVGVPRCNNNIGVGLNAPLSLQRRRKIFQLRGAHPENGCSYMAITESQLKHDSISDRTSSTIESVSCMPK